MGDWESFSKHWKNRGKKFQSLEKTARKLPTLGKNSVKSSKHWKLRVCIFQSLEEVENMFWTEQQNRWR
jgi:hypothetical protein